MRALVTDFSAPKLVLTSLLGRLDKRLFFGPLSTFGLKELPDPELPAPDWVTIRTRLCGICGSDYKQVFLNGSVGNPMTALISFPETVEVAIRVAAPRGVVVVTGVESPKRFEWTPLYFKEIEVVGSNAFGVEEFEGRRRHAMEIYFDLVASGRIDVTPIVTHRFTLDDYRRAFLACAEQEASWAVKVLFTYGDGGTGGGRH